MKNNYVIKLYVSGSTQNSRNAINNLKKLLSDSRFKDQYDLQIIDVSKNAAIAEKKKIMVTPTLIKEFPPPIKRIIGSLNDKVKVLQGIDMEILK